MKKIITKTMCIFLFILIGMWSLEAQINTTILPDGRALIANILASDIDLSVNDTQIAPQQSAGLRSESSLWDNTEVTITNAIVSSYWSYDGGYALCAEDFEAADIWNIKEVIVSGYLSTESMGMTSMGVNIYTDNNGKPGNEIFTDKRIVPVPMGDNKYSLTLLTPCTLPNAGTYWISIYAVFPSATPNYATVNSVRWNWYCGVEVNAMPPQISDPAGIFGIGPGWTSFVDAGLSSYNSMYFSLSGTTGEGEPRYDNYEPPIDVIAAGVSNDVFVRWVAPVGIQLVAPEDLQSNGGKAGRASSNFYLEQYEVFCNDKLIGTTTGTGFLHKNAMLFNGDLNYCVKSVYHDGGKSDSACAGIIEGNEMPQDPGCFNTVYFSETFEEDSQTAGLWTKESLVGNRTWDIVNFNQIFSITPSTTPSGGVGKKAAIYGIAFTDCVARFISPMLNLEDSDAVLSFWHAQQVWSSSQDELRVYYGHSASGPWTLLEEYTGNAPDWTQRIIPLPDLSVTYYLAFEGTVRYGHGVQIDDILIYGGESEHPKPETPANLACIVGELDAYNVVLSWEMPSTSHVEGYYVYRDGILLNSTPVDKNVMRYADIVPTGGSYIYEVQAVSIHGCLSGKNATTIEVEPDLCDGFKINSYPYIQRFEETRNISDLCWKQEILKGMQAWEIASANIGQPATAHGGNQKIRFFSNGSEEHVSRLISPMFDLSEGNGQLSFWYTNERWYMGQDILRIYYKSRANDDWTLLETFDTNVIFWTQATIDLPDNTATYWICIEGNTAQGHGIQIDDIRVSGCTPIRSLPYAEGFELGADAINCWTQEAEDPSLIWSIVSVAIPASHSGIYRMRYNTESSNGSKNRISSPMFNLSREDFDYLKLSFWHVQPIYPIGDPVNDELSIAYRTEAEGDWIELAHYADAVPSWQHHIFSVDNVSSDFQFSFEGTANFGYGVQIDDISISTCDYLPMPFEETFDTGISACWENITTPTDNAPWKFVTAGTSPSVTPHSPGGMLQYNCYSYSNNKKAQLYAAPVKIPLDEQFVEISFWMYRDASYPTKLDKVNVYASSNYNINGLNPILTINRNMGLAPVETAAGWYKYSAVVDANMFPSRKMHIVLEGVSNYGGNIYIDDLAANFYYCDNHLVDLPIETSFENGFPDICWDVTASDDNITWNKIAGDASDGGSFISAGCATAPQGSTTELTTALFLTEENNQVVSFRMYRSSDSSGDDKLLLYVTEDGDINGEMPFATFYRYTGSVPVALSEGWHQYYVILPCADMEKAKVTFQAVSAGGDNIMIDQIIIGDLFLPVHNVEAIGQGAIAPFWEEAYITWEAPALETDSFVGYNVYRNGTTKVASNITALEWLDDLTDIPGGCYSYSVTAAYNNGESERVTAPIEVCIPNLCENIPAPTDLTASAHADGWYDVDLAWSPLGKHVAYSTNMPSASFGFEGAPISSGAKFSPEDLDGFEGGRITKIKVGLNETNTYYNLLIYRGGDGMEPETVLHSQFFSANDYISTNGYAWAEIPLTNQITLDFSDYLWVELESTSYQNLPVTFDYGTVAKPYFSDLLKLNGVWQSATEQGYNMNASIQVYVRLAEGDDEIIGYNVYRNGQLITYPMLDGTETAYRDTAPGLGTYVYEVDAMYGMYCLSERTSVTVEYCIPATNLEAVVADGSVALSWDFENPEADEASLDGDFMPTFNIYKNGDLKANVSGLTWVDTEISQGSSYEYCVVPAYEDCAVEPVCKSVTIDPNSIDDVESTLKIYPNPASTFVIIEGQGVVEIDVYNMLGQLVEQIKTTEGESVRQVNVSSYEAGTYVFRLRLADKTILNKPIMIAR